MMTPNKQNPRRKPGVFLFTGYHNARSNAAGRYRREPLSQGPQATNHSRRKEYFFFFFAFFFQQSAAGTLLPQAAP